MNNVSAVLRKLLFARDLSLFSRSAKDKVSELKTDLAYISDNLQEDLPEDVVSALKKLYDYTEEKYISLSKSEVENKVLLLKAKIPESEK